MKLLSNIVIFSIQNTKIKILFEKNYDTMYFYSNKWVKINVPEKKSFKFFSFNFPPGPVKSAVFENFISKKVLRGVKIEWSC